MIASKVHTVAFSTTLFPMPQEYVFSFFQSLVAQTELTFDVVVLNDGYGDLDAVRKSFPSLNIIEIIYSGTPAQNREHAINTILQSKYEYIIFGDSDDMFSPNRVEKCLEYLNEFDIVVNDVSLFRDEEIYLPNYLSHRVDHEQNITFPFIRDKNIFGLSNTSINTQILSSVSFDEGLVAVDWYFFSILLLEKSSAVFINDCSTIYRQYENNTVGLGKHDKASLFRNLDVKLAHYKALSKLSGLFHKDLKGIAERIKHYSERPFEGNALNTEEYPLWWE